MKIALVKSDWSLFYKKTFNLSIKNIILNSTAPHMPFIGLMLHHSTDVITLKDSIFQKKISLEPAFMGSSKDKKKSIAKMVAPCDQTVLSHEVFWDQYQLIISIDACIPKKIIKKYSKPLWCTMIQIPCYSFYTFNFMPYYGYQVTLSDQLAPAPLTPQQVKHYRKNQKIKIAFPLDFMKSEDVFSLMPTKKKSGIHIDPNSAQNISEAELINLKKFGTVSFLVSKADYLANINSRKYFVILKKDIKVIRGNAIIEANSANCLILIQEGTRITHDKILMPEMFFNGLEELLEKLQTLEKDKKKFQVQFKKQQHLIDQFCYHHPLALLQETLKIHQENHQNGSFTVKKPLKISLLDHCLSLSYPFVWWVLIPLYRCLFFLVEHLFHKDLSLLLSDIINSKNKSKKF